MWDAVQYDDVDYDGDRRALDVLIAVVPPKMQFSLSQKETAKEALDAIAVACIGSDRIASPHCRHLQGVGEPGLQAR